MGGGREGGTEGGGKREGGKDKGRVRVKVLRICLVVDLLHLQYSNRYSRDVVDMYEDISMASAAYKHTLSVSISV